MKLIQLFQYQSVTIHAVQCRICRETTPISQNNLLPVAQHLLTRHPTKVKLLLQNCFEQK